MVGLTDFRSENYVAFQYWLCYTKNKDHLGGRRVFGTLAGAKEGERETKESINGKSFAI